jgi:carbonic anhydrase/acetyltransferase-like protein (isoleucine patch superfamily)
MNSRAARIALVVVGALAVLTGGVWIGQGLSLIPGSVMTGDRTWFYIGLVVLAVGVALVVLGLRRAGRTR